MAATASVFAEFLTSAQSLIERCAETLQGHGHKGVLANRENHIHELQLVVALREFRPCPVTDALIVVQFWTYAGEIAEENRQTWVLQIPLYPFWYVTSLLLGVTAAVQLLNAVANWRAPPTVTTGDVAT